MTVQSVSRQSCPDADRHGANKGALCQTCGFDPWADVSSVDEPTTEDVMIENLARAFHEAYERLAPDYGYATRPESGVPWEQVPEANRKLMMATVARLWGDGWLDPGRLA